MSLSFSTWGPTRGFTVATTCSIGLLAASCGLAEGLTDVGSSLANPDAALLDSPGRQLAEGRYHSLLIDGSLGDGGHVVALRTDRDEQELAIIPYLDGDPCFSKPAHSFDRLSSRINVELPGVLSVLRSPNAAGRGELSFLDFQCENVFGGLEGASLPRVAFPASAPRGLLALTDAGELNLVEAEAQKVTRIATGVDQARSSGDLLWTIESGQLVSRDGDLDTISADGDGVTEFTTTGGQKIAAAFVDEKGVHTWSEESGAQLIAEDGCSPVSWGIDTIAYLSPCEERKLKVRTLGSRIGAESEYVTLLGPAGIVELPRGIAFWGHGTRNTELTFLMGDEGQASGQLVMGIIPEDLQLEGDELEFDVTVLSESGGTIRSGHLYTDWNGATGTLVELKRDEEDAPDGLLTLAEEVAQLPAGTPYSHRGVLANVEDGKGRLVVLSKSDDQVEEFELATQVPVQSQSSEPETGRIAFIGDSEDGVLGTLYLTQGPSDNLEKPQVIDEDVHIDTARFLEQPRGLAYLARPGDSKFAELRVWLIDAGLTITVHERVSEYRTVPWPAPGILYAVPDGEDQGLWFSKAR